MGYFNTQTWSELDLQWDNISMCSFCVGQLVNHILRSYNQPFLGYGVISVQASHRFTTLTFQLHNGVVSCICHGEAAYQIWSFYDLLFSSCTEGHTDGTV